MTRGVLLKESDREIVEAIRAGDISAFEELYRTHFRRVYNFSVRKLSDAAEAEDATQEVFTAVYLCIDRFEGKSDLLVWIFGITRNILNNRLRRRRGIRMISLDEIPEGKGPVDQGLARAAEAREVLGRVQTAISELPQEQRRILELRHSRRLAIKKIAEVTNRSEDAVKSSLYRARRTLAAKLPEVALELR